MTNEVNDDKLQQVTGGVTQKFQEIQLDKNHVIYGLYGYQIYHNGDDLQKIFDGLEAKGVKTSYSVFVFYCNYKNINYKMMYEGVSYPIPLYKEI